MWEIAAIIFALDIILAILVILIEKYNDKKEK